ncbi:MAG TPA: amidohydrolase family protein [Thermoplasmata archaeon]|nr:amidohydrolase family protein [Thermoplasmata archaeon]
MIVEGALVDAEGARPGYARVERGRVVEVGQGGTDSTHGRERRLRGIVVPRPVNAHTHLGDAMFGREPPWTTFDEIVRPPDGAKFRLLATTPARVKVAAMRAELRRLEQLGHGAVIDFREEGVPGARWFRSAASHRALVTFLFGRPVRRPLDPKELAALLEVADGVGLSGIGEEPAPTRRIIAEACRARGKRYALHASEGVREPVEEYLDPRPDLLVHLTAAADDDLRQVVEAAVPVAVNSRSNALFGRRPDFARLRDLGVTTLLGTDNAMLNAPSIWRELEFAYVSARLAGRPIEPEFLFRAAFVNPWAWLGKPDHARIAPDSPAAPLVLRLPPDDPTYQIVTRVTESVMVRT